MAVTYRQRQKKIIVGCFVLIFCICVIGFLSMEEFGVYFYTPKEALEKASTNSSREIRVGGMVKAGSVLWDRTKLSLDFVITDMNGSEIPIKHRGSPPDMFKENSGVVVEGRFDQRGNSFVARNLMVKHSEEYKKPSNKAVFNHEMVKRSIIKGEEG